MPQYFSNLQNKVKVCYSIAEAARARGLDPKNKVEIPLAMTLAEKAIGLISAIYPQLNDKKIINRILQLEKKYGQLDVAVSFKIAEEIAKQKFCKFENLLQAIDAAIRVGFAYNTLGVVSSPIEGYTGIKLKKTKEGKDYFCAYFSGPIRSAGTTASCMALMLIDFLRENFGFAKYDASEEEIKRYVTENYDYHERVTNLQYLPTEEEIEFLAKNIPIQISGEPTESREVSNYKDLPRVETDYIRGGMCLIFSEGLAQKAQKGLRLLKGVKEKGFKSTGWDFLEDYIELHKKREKGTEKVVATYIKDLVAGRPVYGHPSESGGFRFRYGRSRVCGFSSVSIHPATMAVTDNFLSSGTQLKIEKPTKGCVVTSCDSIDGPIVKLKNGSVKKIQDFEEGKKLYKEIDEIIYLGDFLFPIGDVMNRNYDLLKPGYVEEWWKLQLINKLNKNSANLNKDFDKNLEKINEFNIDFNRAIEISEKFNIPLNPKYIFFWTQITRDLFLGFIDWFLHARTNQGKIIFPYNKVEQERFQKGKRAMELLGIEHEVSIENVVLSNIISKALFVNLGLNYNIIDEKNCSFDDFNIDVEKSNNKNKSDEKHGSESKNVLKTINKLSKFEIKDKAGSFIGSRMGRPEKAKLRKLTGSPNVLFPVGNEGGRLRSFQEAAEVGIIKSDFPIYFCDKCKKETIYYLCEKCGSECKRMYYCPKCHQKLFSENCPEHGKARSYMNKRIDSKYYLQDAIEKLGLEKEEIPSLIKGVRGTSSGDHSMENLSKGVLRALFNLQVNKDGTIRYDATELSITHFKPCEINVSIEKLKEIGYTKDIHGKELKNENQILELKPHDVILPSCPESPDEKADDVFVKVAQFIDFLLVRFYGLKPFYNIKKPEDLIGNLVVCMSPHNCAGVIGRIVGFSKTQGLMATPFMHAAMRRDCLSYNSYAPIEKNGEWDIVKIGKFVDNINPKEKADNFGTLKKEISNVYTLGNSIKDEIIEVTKHQPRKMLKIYLEDGRHIKLTENHKVYIKGKKEKRASELKSGDKLIVSYKKNIKEKDIKEIFLPEIFKDREDIMLRNIKDYLSKFENLNKHENFYQRDSFPIKFVEGLLKKYNKTLRDLPAETKIAVKRDNVSIPTRISLNEELLEIIGLYIAEGFLRKNESRKGFYQISIASIDKKIKELIKSVFFSHFNLNPSEDHLDHITFSSRIVYELFKNYLKIGDRAKNKRIPSIFLNLRKEKLAALLRGYFEGDGSVSLSDIRVTCDTISEGLKHDLSFVFSRFDIFAKFYEYKKEPGPKVREFYLKKKRQAPKFKSTKILILSDFVKKFKEIGFISKSKNKILTEICQKKPYSMRIDFDESYAYPKIKKIVETGEEESYCFNVKKEHNFFANDILVHNCDGDEAAVMMLLDVLINFSRSFLPAHRGGTQDAPLVLNSRIRAGEVDDQILDFEIVNETGYYPLKLYEKAENQEHSSEINIETIKTRLKQGKDTFKGLGFTHDSSNFNLGVVNSSYKLIPTMQEKVQRQMELVEKLRAVKTGDVARLVIERHFIRDIRGNLRKFSMQKFRCSKCNEKYRRPPLSGKCEKCGGNIIFTISEGGIIKYLKPALDLADKYDVPEYIKQSLDLAKRYIESVFGKEKEQQEALEKWI